MQCNSYSPQQICDSPLNLSRSKQLYSFSKAKRFKYPQKLICQAFYNIPDNKEKRSTSFGYGKKIDLSQHCGTQPAPNTYKVKSELDKIVQQKKGYSFGNGREKVKFGQQFTIDSSLPGPNVYQVKPLQRNISYTIRAKTPSREEKYTNKYTPGPANYNNLLNISSTNFNSKYKNIGCPKLFKETTKKVKLINKSMILGPGAYETKDSINTSGCYILSKYKNSQVRSFSSAKKRGLITEQQIKNPGPGQYRIPSEFGYYDSPKRSKSKK